MKKLKGEMIQEALSHEIFFVCPDNKEAIDMRLADFGLSPVFKAFGAKEIQALLPA